MPRSCRRHASEVARSLNERSLEIRSRTNALPEGRLSPGARGDHCPAAARVLRGSFSQTRELSLLRSGEMRLLFPKGTCELRTFSGRFRTTMRRCEARDGSEDSCARQCARVCLAIRRDAPVFTPKPASKFRCFFSDNEVFSIWDNFAGPSTAFCLAHGAPHYRLAQNIWRFDRAFALGLMRTEVANCIFQPRNVCDLLQTLPPIWFGVLVTANRF